MPKRRGRGEGTITARGKDRWFLRVYLGRDPVTGKPRQAGRTVTAGTRTEALRLLREFISEAETGKIARVGTDATLNHLLDAWLANLEAAGRSPATIETYRYLADAHLRPAFGDTPANKITGFELDAYYRQKADTLQPRTIRLHHAILSSAFTQAVKWGWLDRNPAEQATPPEKPSGIGRVPEVSQVRQLIDAAGDDTLVATLIVLAALTGARRGDLAGLQWGDVDWKDETLTFSRSRVAIKGVDRTLPPTKKKPARTVSLGPLGIAVLSRWRDVVDQEAASLGVPVPDGAWIVSRDLGRTPMSTTWLSDVVMKLGRKTGVDITPHAFRRFAATQMVGAGVDVRTAAGRLGHTPDMMLRTYAAFMPSKDVGAARGLETLVLGPVVELGVSVGELDEGEGVPGDSRQVV